MIEQCRLCHNNTELKKSHIIPKMFYDTIKSNSTGFLRRPDNPNLTYQDGLKLHFLCDSCEKKFSKFEKYFSDIVYLKTKNTKGEFTFNSRDDSIRYFLLSISWRVLQYVIETDKMDLTTKEKLLTIKVAEQWRELLINENMVKIRDVEIFVIPTSRLLLFEDMEPRRLNSVRETFKTYDKEDEFVHGFILVQVPYYLFVTSVWGNFINKMKSYRVGYQIKPRKSNLPKCIEEIIEQQHDVIERSRPKLSTQQYEKTYNRHKEYLKANLE